MRPAASEIPNPRDNSESVGMASLDVESGLDSLGADDNTQETVAQIVKPVERVVKLLSFFGVYTPNLVSEGRRKTRVVFMVFVVIVNIFVWLCTLSTFLLFNLERGTLNSSFFTKLLILVVTVYISLLFTWMSFMGPKLIISINEWKSFLLSKPTFYYPRYQKTTHRFFYLVVSFMVFSILSYVIGIVLFAAFYPFQIYPLIIPLYHTDMNVILLTTLFVLKIVHSLLIYSVTIIFFALYYAISEALRTEFCQVYRETMHISANNGGNRNPVISQMSKNVKTCNYFVSPEMNNLENIRLKHDTVCGLVELAADFFSLATTLGIGMGLFVICLTVNIIASGLQNPIDFMTALAQLNEGTCAFIIILCGGIRVNDMAHAAKTALYAMDLRRLTDDEQRLQLQMFLSRLNGPPIGFSALGMFVIDRPAVLTIVGAVLTYAIVIFQFQAPDSVGSVTSTSAYFSAVSTTEPFTAG